MKKRDVRKIRTPSGTQVKGQALGVSGMPEEQERLFPVVGIGASAGGLEAFTRLLRALPAENGMAFVYIQHLDPTHPSILAEILARETRMPVREAEDNLPVEPDHVYVIVPNTVLTVSGGVLHLSSRASPAGRFMPVDEFFRSLAADRETLAIGVVLSGTASDGASGIRSINKAGGITFAQNTESATQTGMPQSAIDTGAVDFVLNPDGIAEELVRIGQNPYLIPEEKREAGDRLKHEEKILKDIFTLLRTAKSADFSQYKQSTVVRRIGRRMLLHKLGSLQEYAAYLDDHPGEIAVLAEDMLIHVTSFFREPEIFEVLRTNVFPLFFVGRTPGVPIRIWVPGCSTGEEAYSILMCLLESMEERKAVFPVQVFASDISEPAITKAREGIYPGTEIDSLSEERRNHFFDRLDGNYQVKKELRESCIFAYHDLTKDPPFSHLDFISCRNLLIYLDVPMQRQIIPIFHYSLNPDGILLLGISETVGPFTDLFSAIDQKFRIYRKKPAQNRVPLTFPVVKKATGGPPSRPARDLSLPGFDPVTEANRILGTYGPPSVFVNESMDILQFSGKIGPYLEPVQGAAGLTLNKMIRRDLLVDLRTAIHKAKTTGKPVRKDGVRITVSGLSLSVGFTVLPVHSSRTPEVWHYLLVIEDSSMVQENRAAGPAEAGPSPQGEALPQVTSPAEYRIIEQELADTREHLRAMIDEEHKVSADLLTAFNELQSQNEELQSINEELETAKEELQSSNEELATVNEELQTQLAEREKAERALEKSEEKYRTLIEHNPDVIIRYDRQFRHIYANPAIRNVTDLSPENVIGKTPEEVNFPQNSGKDWQEKIRGVFRTGKEVVTVIESGAGDDRRFFDWFLVPEFGAGGKVMTVLSTIRDITRIRKSEEELRQRNALLNTAYEEVSSSRETLHEKVDELTAKEQELSESLAEKEVLLSEIHHRVKNNLAAFISLLSLDSPYDAANPAGRLFRLDLQNRARSMALVHETLYKTKTFSRVDMEIYLNTLVGQVVTSYSSPKKIRVLVEAEGMTLDLDRAMPCGLIITELVTNTLKYAFPPSFDCKHQRNSPCTLRIAMTKSDDTNLLTVSDNGVGLPSGFDMKKIKTLGLKLVSFLAKYQLKATIEVIPDSGAEFRFRFRDKVDHHR